MALLGLPGVYPLHLKNRPKAHFSCLVPQVKIKGDLMSLVLVQIFAFILGFHQPLYARDPIPAPILQKTLKYLPNEAIRTTVEDFPELASFQFYEAVVQAPDFNLADLIKLSLISDRFRERILEERTQILGRIFRPEQMISFQTGVYPIGKTRTAQVSSFLIFPTQIPQLIWFIVNYDHSHSHPQPSFHHSKQYCPKTWIQWGGFSLCPDLPTENVSWYEIGDFRNAQDHAQKYPVSHTFFYRLNSILKEFSVSNRLTPYQALLPSDLQWQVAAQSPLQKGSPDRPLAWFQENAGNQTHPIESWLPRKNGLFISGNVFEWVYNRYEISPPSVIPSDYLGPVQGELRMIKGGSYLSSSLSSNPALYYSAAPDTEEKHIGFRVVLVSAVSPDTSQIHDN